MLLFYLSMIDLEEDKSKLEQLYNLYSKLMLYVAKGILKDEHLAEDAVHNAFIKIINYLNKIEDISCHKTKGFMVIVVESVAKNMYNKRKKENLFSSTEDEYEITDDINLEEDLFSKMSLEEIVDKIEALSDIYRDVLMFRYIYDFSEKEIAKFLNINYTVIRKRLERARLKLALLLQVR